MTVAGECIGSESKAGGSPIPQSYNARMGLRMLNISSKTKRKSVVNMWRIINDRFSA